jgi:negative regulator of sigma-B (phosphoserine phosphatase)
MVEQGRSGPWEWAVASRPKGGEEVCGDQWVVAERADGTLFAAIDGLGHGQEAAAASRLAVEVLAQNAPEPLEVLLVLCHQALAASRGAAVTLAVTNRGGQWLRWLGVGNVSGFLLRYATLATLGRGQVAALVLGGIVGLQLPTLRAPEPVETHPGDMLILATDGARLDLEPGSRLAGPISRLACDLLHRNATPTDDALVLIARQRGDTAG